MAETGEQKMEVNPSSTATRSKKYGKLHKKMKRIQTENSGALTPSRGDFDAAVERLLEAQLAEWISTTCTIEPPLQAESFFQDLRDGIILCQFFQILTGVKPSSKLHSRSRCQKSDLMCHDNIIVFLEMIEDYTIPEVRFDSIQLVEGKGYKAVNNCLLYISVELAKRGMLSLEELPEETKKLYDKWLTKKDKNKKRKKKKHIDDEKDPAPFAGIEYKDPPESSAALKADAIVENEEEDIIEDGLLSLQAFGRLSGHLIDVDDLNMMPVTDDETESESVTSDIDDDSSRADLLAGGASDISIASDKSSEHITPDTKPTNAGSSKKERVQFSESEKAKKDKKNKGALKKKKKKRKKRRTCYGFTAKDEMDHKIMDAFNAVSRKSGISSSENGFGGLQIKKLRRPGEFQFGDSKRKTYIREVNGKLFCRVAGGWEELTAWIEKRVKLYESVGSTAKAKKLLESSDAALKIN